MPTLGLPLQVQAAGYLLRTRFCELGKSTRLRVHLLLHIRFDMQPADDVFEDERGGDRFVLFRVCFYGLHDVRTGSYASVLDVLYHGIVYLRENISQNSVPHL